MAKVIITTNNDIYTTELDVNQEEALNSIHHIVNTNKFIIIDDMNIIPTKHIIKISIEQ